MATSRLEKIGTIFTRVNGLIKTGAMRFEDRPLWYDIYKSFPPIDEPRYDRPAPDIPIKKIFYEEDIIRAQYHKEVKPGVSNLFNNDYKTKTRRFIETYNKLEVTETVSKEELFEMAMVATNQELDDRKQAKDTEKLSLAKTFTDAQEDKSKIAKVDVSKIMKDE